MNRLKKGNQYEKYILSIILKNYKFCLLWKDIKLIDIEDIDSKIKLFINKSGKICDDIGCDILGINFDNSFDFIQCKDYSMLNSIKICDFSGFYRFCSEYSFGQPVVYYSGRLSCQITKYNNRIKYINIPSECLFLDKIDILPRDYQIDAYNKLKGMKTSVLDMPCGMGKTIISYLLSLDYDNIIILTPKISTCEQITSHYKKYYGDTTNIIQINCQNERNSNIKLKDTNILISTYDSCDIINKLIKKMDTTPFVVIDEFHNLSENNMINGNNEIYKLLHKKIYLLYMSATPKYYDGINYGKIHSYDWKEAIKKKYICDFNFHLPEEKLIKSETTIIKINDEFDIDIKMFNQMYFIFNGLNETKSKKCIVYCKSIELCEIYKSCAKILNKKLNYNLKLYEITYETTKKERRKIIEQFTNDEKNINMIFSIHVLDEGIDIAPCDSIFITNLNDNPLNLTQRISRCNRIDNNNVKKIANVFIWTNKYYKLNSMLNNKFIVAKQLHKPSYIKEKTLDNGVNMFINEYILLKNKFNLNNFVLKDVKVAKYLGIKQITLRNRLTNTYSKTKRFIEKVDYIKIREGHTIIYYLNYPAFEKLAMSGDSKKSEEMREYFVKLREFLTENQRTNH